MILYAAVKNNEVYGIGTSEQDAARDARRSGAPKDLTYTYRVITVEQAKRFAAGAPLVFSP